MKSTSSTRRDIRIFSEDTYRVLTAVDSALMVIDGAKGVEPQTEKLMEVCLLRNTPVITFINKLDREGLPPLELLTDIEKKLQIECVPMSWPIGMGKSFRGVYNLYRRELQLFTPGASTRGGEVFVIRDLDDPELERRLGSQADELREDIALMEGAANPFVFEHFLKANQTPVFFGSAINNFGVRELLDAVVELAPSPRPRLATTREVLPSEEQFSGLPSRFRRIWTAPTATASPSCGLFRKIHPRDESPPQPDRQRLTLANATIFMAQDRASVEEAYPETSSAFTTMEPSGSATPSPRGRNCALPASPISPRNISAGSV